MFAAPHREISGKIRSRRWAGGLDGVAMIFVVLGGALRILGGPTPRTARLLTPLTATNPHRTVQAANVSGQQAPANCLWA